MTGPVLAPPAPRADPAPMPRASGHLRRRRLANRVGWILCGLALALMVVPLVWVVGGVVVHAAGHWDWSVLTTTTQGNGGGLLNAILGTLVIVVGVVVIAGVIGVAGGVYLAEFLPPERGTVLRGASEVLAGVPSILFGYVGYLALVAGGLHWGYGLLPALVVLSVLVVPYVARSTEVAVRNVPTAYREGAEALGMPSHTALRKVVIRPALPGIATGLIFAAAIAVGETAPLLYTAGWSTDIPSLPLTHNQVGYLTYPVFTFINLPGTEAHQLAYDAALLLVVLVVTLMVIARVLVSLTQKHAPGRAQRVTRKRRRP